MQEMGEHLLQIGLFSKLSLLSVRMLRHYQEHGLLIPARIDPVSGYRYYRTSQLREAEQIRQLRDSGFGVVQMAGILRVWDEPTQLAAALSQQSGRLSAQLNSVYLKRAALEQLIDSTKETTMTVDVRRATLPAMTVAALRDVIASYSSEGELWQQLAPLAAQSGAECDPAGIGGATFYDEDYRETDVDVEVWMQVTSAFSAVSPLQCLELPEQHIVTATLKGGYERMSHLTAAIGTYIAENDLVTGPMFNIYRVSPAQDPNPDNWVTDVCFPLLDD